MQQNNHRRSVIISDPEVYDPMERFRNSNQVVSEDVTSNASSDLLDEEDTPPYIEELQVEQDQNTTNNNKSTQESEEEPASDNGDDGVEVIAQGAMCKCTEGTKIGNLNIICQFKVYCNGGTKLVGTTQEHNFLSLSFGSCKAKKNTPCIAKVTWSNFYEDVRVTSGLKILTMDSKATCSIGGGQIEFLTSGQSQSITTKNIESVDRESLKNDNPLLRTENTPVKIVDSGYEETINEIEKNFQKQLEEEVGVILENVENIAKGTVTKGIIPIRYKTQKKNGAVKQPKQVFCDFLGTDNGTLTWKVRDENMNIIHEAEGKGTIQVRFPKYGRYVIEAYGNSSTVKENTKVTDIERNPTNYFNTLIVDVVPNEIILTANNDKSYAGSQVKIEANNLFENSVSSLADLRYRIIEKGIEVGSDKAEISNKAGTGCTILFKEAGSYVVTADPVREIQVKPTGGITIENIRLTEVRVNDKKSYKARKKETLEFSAHLNYEDEEAKKKINWQVSYSKTQNGTSKIVYPIGGGKTNLKPSQAIFVEEGFYSIQAYMNSPSNTIKATLEITRPYFVAVVWKDKQHNNVLEIGKRETIYANIQLEGVEGVDMVYKLCWLSNDVVLRTVNHKNVNVDVLVIDITLSDEECKRLKNEDKLYWKIEAKDSSITVGNKSKDSKEFPITYTTAEKITSFAFYADKDCKEALSVASYGSTIYAQVLTRNLTGKSLDINIFRKTPGWLWGTNNVVLHSSRESVDANGIAVFEIKISNVWKNKENDTYAVTVTEKDDDFFKEKSLRNWETNKTAEETFSIGRNLAFMKFVDQPTSDEEGQAITKVAKTDANSSKKGKCIHCEEDITIDQIKRICVDTSGKCLISDDSQLASAIKFFNENKEFFDLTTCTRKVHFLSQIAEETHFSKLEETSFDYTTEALKIIFSAFRTDVGVQKAELWGRKDGDPPTSKDNQIKIANWAYARPRNDRGNKSVADADLADATKDGYRYRGRGYIQVTGRGIYKSVSDSYNKWLAKPKKENEVDWENNEDELKNGKQAMAATMTYWKYSNIISRSDMGTSDNAIKVVTQKINGGQTNFDERKRFLEKAIEVLDCQNCVDHKRRNANQGTVVIVSGVATEKKAGFAAYPVSVYRGMTLEIYKDLKAKEELPEPDYKTLLSRDTHQKQTKDKKTGEVIIIKHSNKRYGYANECPPSEYYLNNKRDAGGDRYMMYLSDTSTGSIIKGPDGDRDGIAFHQYTGNGSIGCLTTLEGSETTLINELNDAIPDLWIHHQMKNAKIIIPRRYVRVILEEREVTEETWESTNNGTTRWRGVVNKNKKTKE